MIAIEHHTFASCFCCGRPVNLSDGESLRRGPDGHYNCEYCDDFCVLEHEINEPICEYCGYEMETADIVNTERGDMHLSCATRY